MRFPDYNFLRNINLLTDLQIGFTTAKTIFQSIFFLSFSHINQTSGWIPPMDSWDAGGTNLPFGWESAIDKDGRTYYVK